jgi:hypothetical protein
MCAPVRNAGDRKFRRQCQIAVASSLVLYVTCSQASLRLHNSATGMVLSGVIWIPMLLICVTAAAKVLIFRQYRPESE